MLREEMKFLMSMSCPSIVTFHGAFLDQSKKVGARACVWLASAR
jgi:hypothetical protein